MTEDMHKKQNFGHNRIVVSHHGKVEGNSRNEYRLKKVDSTSPTEQTDDEQEPQV